jgi:hypothetical protein
MASLKSFLLPRPPQAPAPLASPLQGERGGSQTAWEAWTEFKIRQLEARQAWLQKILFLIVLALLAERFGLEKVEAWLALFR